MANGVFCLSVFGKSCASDFAVEDSHGIPLVVGPQVIIFPWKFSCLSVFEVFYVFPPIGERNRFSMTDEFRVNRQSLFTKKLNFFGILSLRLEMDYCRLWDSM